ncbi:spore gernimation protein [Cohnella faecalis]|uniref:Spore gernimation protein n=1 Tax=Cohnella faecalis TaxID=2315694 RepID=A0A398CMY1_9BACL|nr:spore gernimation protein [Cohnella faecalis]
MIINFILAAGILSFPRVISERMGTPDGWISILLSGGLAMVEGIIIVKLSQRFPQKTFFEYSQEIVGRWVGIFASILVIGYFLVLSAFEIRMMAEVTNFFLLEGTPSWAVIMPLMWVALYLMLGGIQPIARLFELILPITALVFLIAIFLGFHIFDIDRLRPVLGLGLWPVFEGMKESALYFLGSEVMLFLVAFMQKPDKGVKAVVSGVAFTVVFYLITFVIVIGALSLEGTEARTWPTVDVLRSFELQGLFFERFESLLLVIWIMQIFSTYTTAHYGAALGLAQLFKKDISPFAYGLLPIIFIVAMAPKSVNDVFSIGDFIGNFGLWYFGLFPLLCLIAAKWRGRGK